MALPVELTGLWELCIVGMGPFALFCWKWVAGIHYLALADVYANMSLVYHMQSHRASEKKNI